jgi:hypothetical protein
MTPDGNEYLLENYQRVLATLGRMSALRKQLSKPSKEFSEGCQNPLTPSDTLLKDDRNFSDICKMIAY